MIKVIRSNLITEGLKPKSAKPGEIYESRHNLTNTFLYLPSETNLKYENSINLVNLFKYDEEGYKKAIDDLESILLVSGNKNSVKIKPGVKFELINIVPVSSRFKAYANFKLVGYDYKICMLGFDFKYIELENTPVKEKTSEEYLFAVYGAGNSLSTSNKRYNDSIIWKWTQAEEGETRTQFSKRVSQQAERLAQQSFQYYTDNSIVKKIFTDKDKFIKFCNDTCGFNPNIKE